MRASRRQKTCLFLSALILVLHIFIAIIAKPSFNLTMVGDVIPCLLLTIAMVCYAENFQRSLGILSLFWKLSAAGLAMMFLSQVYWIYYDSVRRYGIPSPVAGDLLFLLAHVFFLSAFALRPHSMSAGRDLRTRRLDFVLLTLWWFSLYGYFCLPWQWVAVDFSKYNPGYYRLSLVQHVVIVLALATLAARKNGAWRQFYVHLLIAFLLIAGGNLLLSVSIDGGKYYAGSLYDTPFFLSVVWLTIAGCYGNVLQPVEESQPNRELKQSVWTARVAMCAILSLPLIAVFGIYESHVPAAVSAFRLRLVFGSIFLLGALAFWKLNLLARELAQLVRLTQESIENLKSVQQRITQSQKLAALGRLAAGATHEISNPLTAILGYSELLADIPDLSGADRDNAHAIQQQVHHAQSAVNSLRNTLRTPSPSHSIDLRKPPVA